MCLKGQGRGEAGPICAAKKSWKEIGQRVKRAFNCCKPGELPAGKRENGPPKGHKKRKRQAEPPFYDLLAARKAFSLCSILKKAARIENGID